jgi:hypothetical protein
MTDPYQEREAGRLEYDLIELIEEAKPTRDVRGYVRQFLHPGYHLRKIREDVRAARHALQNRDLESLRCDVAAFAKAIRGRLFAAYFLVGPFALVGFLAGTWYQYATALPYEGIVSYLLTLLVGNLGSTVGFQLIWAVAHRRLYWGGRTGSGGGWMGLWRDLLVLQWRGFKLFVVASALIIPGLALMLAVLDRLAPQFVSVMPVAATASMLELFFVHGTLVRLMGDLFERESVRIAENHCAVGG